MAKEETPKIISKKHLARMERERRQNRWIVIVSIVIIVLVVGVLGYGVLNKTVLEKYQPVAKVGNDSITTEEFQSAVKFARWQYIQQYKQTAQLISYFGSDPNSAAYFQQSLTQIKSTLDDPTTLGDSVLTNLIQNKLIRQEAAKRGIVVKPEEIDKALQEAFGYFANGTPTPTATPEIFPTSTLTDLQKQLIATATPTLDLTPTTELPSETPAPTSTIVPSPTAGPTTSATSTEPTPTPLPTATPYTLDGYKTTLNNYVAKMKDAGLAEADIRVIIENQLYREKVEAAVTADLSRDQDQVWARHILVSDKSSADSIYEQLTKFHADWNDMVTKHTIDTGSKDTGGDLGWFGKGTMVAEFDTAVFAMKIGDISQPVQTKFGYHIIQLLGHETRHLDDAAFKTLKDTTFNTYVTTLQSAAKITKNDIWKDRVPTIPTLAPADIVPTAAN